MSKVLKMPFTFEGVTFPDAVWDVVDLHVTTEGAMIKAYVYANPAARNAKQPLLGGQAKEVHIGESLFGDPMFTALIEQVKVEAAWPILRNASALLVGEPPKQVVIHDKPQFEEDGVTPVLEPDTRENFFASGEFVEV